MLKKILPWFLWLAVAACLAGYLWISLSGDRRTVFLPNDTTSGHYQIELKCEVCHVDAFGGVKVDACNACHAAELKLAHDSHPKSKFTDPRNANLVKILDARDCMTCHVEHQPGITGEMGVTLPIDYCSHCHQDIAKERPSHEGMGFETCATAGCHNFHDNTALYEDFLLKHLQDPDFRKDAVIPARDFYSKKLADEPTKPLQAADHNGPESADQLLIYDWASSAHAAAGVNCNDCHNVKDTALGKITWVEHIGFESCKSCHENEVAGFLGGKHGMRLAQGLSAMQPSMAHAAMHPSAAHKELSCVSCHGDHRFDTQFAAVDACMSCHNDEHTRNYKESTHYTLWLAELGGKAPKGSGISCATCHLPRVEQSIDGVKQILVQHNQNDNLRPNEKMVRSACLHCHGLQFSLDALADKELIRENFGQPVKRTVESLEMVRDRSSP